MGWSPDWSLRLRMIGVLIALVVLYVAFVAALATHFGHPLAVIAGVALLTGAQFWWGHRIALRSMGASVVSERERPELHARVFRLAQQAGIPKPAVAVADTEMPNAFAAGRSKETAVVCVTTGLLESLDDDELDGVLAHELAHVQNHDLVVMTVAATLSTLAYFVVRWGFIGGGNKGQQYTWVAVLGSLGVWICSLFVTRLLSRYREFAADRGAATITGNPAALASALLTIDGRAASVPDEDLREHAGMSAMFLYGVPQSIGIRSWQFDVSNWLRTHPAIDDRVERLHRLEAELSHSR